MAETTYFPRRLILAGAMISGVLLALAVHMLGARYGLDLGGLWRSGTRDFMPESDAALARLAAPDAAFRVRYLRVGPTAELAAASPSAHALLDRSMLADTDPHVRAAAVHAVHDARAYQSSLLRALADADPRVRMEAAHGLQGAADGAAAKILARGLWRAGGPPRRVPGRRPRCRTAGRCRCSC